MERALDNESFGIAEAGGNLGCLRQRDQKFFRAFHVGTLVFMIGHRAMSSQTFIRAAIRWLRICSRAFILGSKILGRCERAFLF